MILGRNSSSRAEKRCAFRQIAPSAEISRAGVAMDPASRQARNGRTVDAALCSVMLDEELAKLRDAAGDGGRYDDAAKLFRELVEAPTFPEFLTLPAYDIITTDA
jgi:malate synthase